MKFHLRFVLTFFLFVGCASKPKQVADDRPYLLLISIDGYRSDYTELFNPPRLTQLARQGLRAEGLRPSFPSKTFPNHLTLATGLLPIHHGIVSNEFMEPKWGETYALGKPETVGDAKWYSGIPIWNLAERNGLKAACFFWPSSEAPIEGIRPTHYKLYDARIPNKERVDQVVRWLSLPESERPHIVTLYFSTVDSAGHEFGPTSRETHQAVLELDEVIGELVDRVAQLNLPINYVIVSDHGMQEIDESKLEVVDRLASLSDFERLGDGTHTLLYLKPGRDRTKVEKTLKKLHKSKHQFTAYKSNTTPEQWKYTGSARVGDIVLTQRAPYYMQFKDRPLRVPKGNHGYDPLTTPSMLGIFYAWGPGITPQSKPIPVFDNIHIYPFLAKLLGLSPPPDIDGKAQALEGYVTPTRPR